MNPSRTSSLGVVSLCSAVLFAFAACESDGGSAERGKGPAGFMVEFAPEAGNTVEQMTGTKDAPLGFRNRFDVGDPAQVPRLNITALTADNTVREDFTARVRLRVVPGQIEPGKDIVQLVNGRADGVVVPTRFAYDEARIWVEDIGIPEWVGGLCSSDDVCTFGLVCNNGTCQHGPCSDTPDCPVGHFCNGGQCAPQACNGGACPTGYFCEAGVCNLRPNCSEGTPCPAGFDCEAGICLVNECANGKDDNGNGLTDFPRDYHCDVDERAEAAGSWTTGVSQGMFFEPPTIRSVQENPDSATGPSPLAGQAVEIRAETGHDLVVTNVVGTGFYVTDLADQNYNSVFIFNFSFPEGVFIGDRVCEISGGVVEFNALTQMQFPSWGLQGKPRSTAEQRLPNPEDEDDLLLLDNVEIVDCSDAYGLPEKTLSKTLPTPEPVLLTPQIIRTLAAMEKLEGSLVTVENIELSVRFLDCDDNGSGRIESGTAEASCRNECNRDLYCTELTSLFSFDQWRGVTGGAEISVSSTQLVADFDVLAGCTEGRTEQGRLEYICGDRANPRMLRRVTGSLRQIVPTCDRFAPCDPADEGIILFIIDPRFESDIVE